MIDILQDEAYDLRNAIVQTAYTPESAFEQAHREFAASAVPRYGDGFERYLRTSGVTSISSVHGSPSSILSSTS